MQTKKPQEETAPPSPSPPLEQFLAERDLRAFCLQAGHELAGLMGAVLGELSYGLSTGNPHVQGRSMAIALSAAERALHLSASLRFLGGITPPAPRQADVSQLLLEVVDALDAELNVRSIRLRALAETPTGATTDPSTLKHLIKTILLAFADGMKGGGAIDASLKIESEKLTLTVTASPSLAETQTHFPDLAKSTPFRLANELLVAQGGGLTFAPAADGKPSAVIVLPRDPTATPPPTFESRRRSQRVRVALVGELALPGCPPVSLEIPILSEKGCYLVFSRLQPPRPLRVNQTGSLKIFYFEGESIDIEAVRIASLDPKGHGAGVGVEFTRFTDRAKMLIGALIRSHSS